MLIHTLVFWDSDLQIVQPSPLNQTSHSVELSEPYMALVRICPFHFDCPLSPSCSCGMLSLLITSMVVIFGRLKILCGNECLGRERGWHLCS